MNPLSSPGADTTPKPDDTSLLQQNQQDEQLDGTVQDENLAAEAGTPAETAAPSEQPVAVTSSPFAADPSPETSADSSSEQTPLAAGQTSDTAPAVSVDENPSIEPTPVSDDAPEPQAPVETASTPEVTPLTSDATPPVDPAPEVAANSTLDSTPTTSTPETAADLPATKTTNTGTATSFNSFDAAASGAVFGAAAAVSSSPGQEPQAAQGGAPQRNKKKLLAIIAGAVLGVALISSAIAFAIIRETPEMILKDMFYATSKKTEGNFDLRLDSESDGKTVKASALGAFKSDAIRSDIAVEGTMLPMDKISIHQYATKEKMYLKVDDVRKHIEKLSSMYPSPESGQMIAMLDTLISKIDGKWLVITEDDLEKYFGIKPQDDKYSVCVENALKSYQSDKKQQKEVFEAYNKNRFILLTKLADEKISDRNAYHFSVKIDEKKADTFGEAVTKTAVYKNVKKCLPDAQESTFDPPKNETKEEDVPDLQLWVDKQTRTFRKIQVKPTEAQQKKENVKGQLSLTLDFFSKVTMNEPKADVTVGELKAEVDKLMQQPGGPSYGIPAVSPVGVERQPFTSTTLDSSTPQLLGAQTEQPQFMNVAKRLFNF